MHGVVTAYLKSPCYSRAGTTPLHAGTPTGKHERSLVCEGLWFISPNTGSHQKPMARPNRYLSMAKATLKNNYYT